MKISLHKMLITSIVLFMLFAPSCDISGQYRNNCTDYVEGGFMTAFVLPIACNHKLSREECFRETEDGFAYYYNDNVEDGAYLLDIPDTPDIIIPEYVENHKIVKLGYRDIELGKIDDYIINSKRTKNLTIQHEFISETHENWDQIYYYVNFINLETLTFIDYLYCNLSSTKEELIVPHYIGKKSGNVPNVILKKSDREYSLEEFKPKVIIIPEYVTVIEKGVFDGLEDVVIKTSYESIPEGWEEGWNGSCEVIWGEEIDYLSFYDCIQETEDGFIYYYNSIDNDGVYIFDVPSYILGEGDLREIVIPEYINGKKVLELGNRYAINGYGTHYSLGSGNIEKLTILHEFSITPNLSGTTHGDYICFPDLENLIFVDYLYCNLTKETNELIVPWYIGEDPRNHPNHWAYEFDGYPSVELKKSDREYSLENFKPKVIIIPEYVTIIEKGVFDGLEDVVIKTSYESIPEGWEEGWNGDCEVMWGEDLELE